MGAEGSSGLRSKGALEKVSKCQRGESCRKRSRLSSSLRAGSNGSRRVAVRASPRAGSSRDDARFARGSFSSDLGARSRRARDASGVASRAARPPRAGNAKSDVLFRGKKETRKSNTARAPRGPRPTRATRPESRRTREVHHREPLLRAPAVRAEVHLLAQQLDRRGARQRHPRGRARLASRQDFLHLLRVLAIRREDDLLREVAVRRGGRARRALRRAFGRDARRRDRHRRHRRAVETRRSFDSVDGAFGFRADSARLDLASRPRGVREARSRSRVARGTRPRSVSVRERVACGARARRCVSLPRGNAKYLRFRAAGHEKTHDICQPVKLHRAVRLTCARTVGSRRGRTACLPIKRGNIAIKVSPSIRCRYNSPACKTRSVGMVRPTAPRCSAGAASERPGFGAATSIPTRDDPRAARGPSREEPRSSSGERRGGGVARTRDRAARAREGTRERRARTDDARPTPPRPSSTSVPSHPPVRRRRRRWRRASRRRRARARCVSTPPRAPGGAIPRRPSSVRFVRPARRRPSTHRRRRRPPTHLSHLISRRASRRRTTRTRRRSWSASTSTRSRSRSRGLTSSCSSR